MKQAEDFRDESMALGDLLESLDDASYGRATLFKGWAINDVLGHLHMFNVAALRTLQSKAAFEQFFTPILQGLGSGQTLLQTQYPWLNGLGGRALFDAWRDESLRLADAYAGADPKQRVSWAGPDMTTLSCITARQMETWAHGQAIFDLLGVERREADRIRNIAHLGVRTFGWTFKVRGQAVPAVEPYVQLTGPSGAQWQWGTGQRDNSVEGLAVDFARVVTQVRNVADTSLRVTGPVAERWMASAQCFAGPPETPPAPGTRHSSRAT